MREAVFSSSEFRIRAAETPPANYLLPWAKNAAASLFFTLFPADCRICGAPLVEISRLPVCHACLESLRPLAGSFCSICGEALFSPAFIDRGDARCGLCQRAHPLFERAAAYGSYDGGLRDLIHLLKYRQVRPAANVLGRMLSEVITGLDTVIPAGGLAVIPVPLHQRKRAQRGFNQSELIARAALKVLGKAERFQLSPDALVRQRETGSQIGLTRHQRRENMRGAFRVVEAGAVQGKNVLLVDDVFTTGTTVSECARVLRKAGANAVWVATVARTLKVVEVFAVPEKIQEEAPAEDRMAMAAHG
ncbi:MAG TPA: ComF family protein [Bryobacteraceae bacterium]